MSYYDGNTVTGLWNYAQHFAMSDNAYGTTYGPSTPGALNVTARPDLWRHLRPDVRDDQRQPVLEPGRAQHDHPHVLNITAGSAGRRRARNDLQRRRPDLRHLLLPAERRRRRRPHRGPDPHDGRQQHRRRADQLQRHLGLVRGRLRRRIRPRSRHAPDHRADLLAEPQERGRLQRDRLHPAPRAVRVLRIHRQPHAPAADVGGDDRPDGPGQPPVRHRRLLGRGRRGQPARGLLPEGAGLPGRSRGLLRPAGRADLAGQTPSTTWRACRPGTPPRSSSPGTTPTAGTTTYSPRSSPSRRPRWTR